MENQKKTRVRKPKVRTFKVSFRSIHDDFFTITTSWSKKELREVAESDGIVEQDFTYHTQAKKVRVKKIEDITGQYNDDKNRKELP